MPSRLKKFVQSWVINTLAVLVAVSLVQGIRFPDHTLLARVFWAFTTSLLLGVLNAFIRPIIMFLALPVLIFTLGLFMFVINALLLYLVAIVLNPHFQVDGFWAAFWGALIISFVSMLLNGLTGTGGTRIEVRRGRRRHPRRRDSGGGDDGPVIDV